MKRVNSHTDISIEARCLILITLYASSQISRAGLNIMYLSVTYMELNILSKDVNAKPIANMDFIFT